MSIKESIHKKVIAHSTKSKEDWRVGAIITDADYNVISYGVNDAHTHAEVRAIINANQNLDSCKIFVSSDIPCVNCCIEIARAGIDEVICTIGGGPHKPKWIQSSIEGEEILKKSKIKITFYQKNLL